MVIASVAGRDSWGPDAATEAASAGKLSVAGTSPGIALGWLDGVHGGAL